MAIAFDASTISNIGSTPSTVTISFTVGNNSNRGLIVSVSNNSITSSAIASVTFNGIAFTSIRRDVGTLGSGMGTIESFYLIAPEVGTYNVVVTQGATKSSYITTVIGSYYGVAQASSIDVSNYKEYATDASYSISATTTTDNTWGVIGAFSQRGISASTNTTARSGSGTGSFIGDTNGAQTPAGSKSMALTISESPWSTWGHVLFIKPYVTSTNNGAGFFILM